MNKADQTRLYILEKAFEIIYRHGYQSTSIDKIIETTNVTKGAFYYHFKNKEEMGLAVINEVIYPHFHQSLIVPLRNFTDPVKGIYETIKSFMMGVSEDQLRNGCPTNNLIQEMAPLNPKFSHALKGILEEWRIEIAGSLSRASQESAIKKQDYDQVASFIISSYEGTRGLGKLHNSYQYYEAYLNQLNNFLKSVKKNTV